MQDTSDQLSPNFKETELSVANAPESVKENARWLCVNILEPIRAWWGRPVKVNSGYRPPEHNAAVGGVKTSYHLYNGDNCASDIVVLGVPVTEVFDWLRTKSTLPFSKVIMEKDKHTNLPTVVHIQAHAGQTPTTRLAYIGDTHGQSGYTAVTCAGL
jgi:hypothetical protein